MLFQLGWSMTISDYNYSKKFNTIWIAPPRTGTRGLCKILCYLHFEYQKNIIFDGSLMRYTHDIPPSEILKGKDVIVSVRNPYGRLYSMFKNYFQHDSNLTFQRYVENLGEKILNHTAFNICEFSPNYVVRLENQFEDLCTIPFIVEKLGEKKLKLLTSHDIKIHEWENEYNNEMKEKVYFLFRKQFETYGYEK